jgi:hypothetical protein
MQEFLMKKIIAIIFVALYLLGCATTAKIPELFSTAREQAIRYNLPIIMMLRGRTPNSAGGVAVELEFENISDKTINSIIFSITPYNEAGKPVACDVRLGTCSVLKATGPFRPGTHYSRSWENVWYSRNISCLRVDSVTVRYLDDATQMINKTQELNTIVIPYLEKSFYLFNPDYPGVCESSTHTISSPPR